MKRKKGKFAVLHPIQNNPRYHTTVFEKHQKCLILIFTWKIINSLASLAKFYLNLNVQLRLKIARLVRLANASSVHSFCQLGCSLKYNPFMKIYNTQNTSTKLGLLWDRKQLILIFRLVYFEHKNSVFSSVPRKPKNSFCKVYKNCIKQVKDISCCSRSSI